LSVRRAGREAKVRRPAEAYGQPVTENERLVGLIRRCPWLMAALRAGRDVDAPSWVIGAGAIRDLVFDDLHGRRAPPPRDVDYAFFDRDDLTIELEHAIERALRRRLPDLPFEARNQARVHLWYEHHFGTRIEPYRSIEHAVSTWPETATAVACRLLRDDEIEVIAPLGCDDLFGGVLRRNPAQATRATFEERLTRRPDLATRWPQVRVVFD
jgi:hypothetical protein